MDLGTESHGGRAVSVVMQSVGNFRPEWGYVATPLSLRHTLAVALVATAVGATAGATVVLSLVDCSPTELVIPSFSERALANKAEASEPTTAAKDQLTMEEIPPPALLGTVDHNAIAVAPGEAGHHAAAVQIEQKAGDRGRVVPSRRKAHSRRFVYSFAPFAHFQSW